ncbi:MAG: ParB/RepB/Spo0J family partition protein [Sciscionella sp.]
MNNLIQDIPVDKFDLSLSQMRIVNPKSVSRIQDLMHLHGQLQPVVARSVDGGYQVIDGIKRVYAAIDLALNTLRCCVLNVDLQQAKLLILNYNRSVHSMEVWEEAMVLSDLAEHHGLSQQRLSNLTGYSRSWVSRRLSLISKLSDELVSEIRLGVISSTQARALIKLPRGNQMEVARVIVSKGLASRQSDTYVDAFLKAKDRSVQELLLNHPEEAFTANIEEPRAAYDHRLSKYGNELLCFAREALYAIKFLLRSLESKQVDDLNASENIIILQEVEKSGQYAQKLMEVIANLQTHKPLTAK